MRGYKWEDVKPVHKHRCERWLLGLYFFHQFIDIIHLHDFNLQLYKRSITLGNHGHVSGHLWKKTCAHFFLRNFFHDVFKMVYDLRSFKIIIHIFGLPSFSTLSAYFQISTGNPLLYPSDSSLCLKLNFLSSFPQSHLLFLLYSLSWWIHGDWLLIPKFMDAQVPFIKWRSICM